MGTITAHNNVTHRTLMNTAGHAPFSLFLSALFVSLSLRLFVSSSLRLFVSSSLRLLPPHLPGELSVEVEVEGRHGSHAARRGRFMVTVHIDLQESSAARKLLGQSLVGRGDHMARPARFLEDRMEGSQISGQVGQAYMHIVTKHTHTHTFMYTHTHIHVHPHTRAQVNEQ